MKSDRSLVGPASALTIGLLNTTGIPALMALSVLAPVLGTLQPTRARAAVSVGTYYVACSWPALVIIRNYAGLERALVFGPPICLAAAFLLSLPFWLLWSPNQRAAAWMIPVSILVSAVPPLGVIGIGSPLIVSGLLFPAAGWLGVLFTFAVPSAVLLRSKLIVAAVAVTSAFFHFRPVDTPQPPQGWIGVNTNATCESTAIECDYRSLVALQHRAQQLLTGVMVFPEAAVRDWTDATELFWQETNYALQRHSANVLLGATVRSNGINRNVVLVRGTEANIFVQRVPAPIGMWQPFVTGSFPLNLTGPATITVSGKRVAVLICYEQLIPWTWLSAMAETPSVIVAISNDAWSGGTPLARYRSAVARSWSALFRLPFISATND